MLIFQTVHYAIPARGLAWTAWHGAGKGRFGTPPGGVWGFGGSPPSTRKTNRLCVTFANPVRYLCVTLGMFSDCALLWVRCGGAESRSKRHLRQGAAKAVGAGHGEPVEPHSRSRSSARPASFLLCPNFLKIQTRGLKMNWRLTIFEFLAAPAHGWLWCCGRLVGWEFTCGPVNDEED